LLLIGDWHDGQHQATTAGDAHAAARGVRLGARRSTLGARRSTLGARRSTLDARRSTRASDRHGEPEVPLREALRREETAAGQYQPFVATTWVGRYPMLNGH
jgi:hypothetical protein